MTPSLSRIFRIFALLFPRSYHESHRGIPPGAGRLGARSAAAGPAQNDGEEELTVPEARPRARVPGE